MNSERFRIMRKSVRGAGCGQDFLSIKYYVGINGDEEKTDAQKENSEAGKDAEEGA